MEMSKISDNEILVKVIASGICESEVMEWYRIKKAPNALRHKIKKISSSEHLYPIIK